MIKAVLFCLIYALLNVAGAAIIKMKLKGKVLTSVNEWINFLFTLEVITAFVLIFVSALVMFKALSAANFTFVIPISAGINFILTVIVGYYLFRDNLNIVSFVGFGLIISGIILLSVNNAQHA